MPIDKAMPASQVQADDVLTIPGTGMFIVRNVRLYSTNEDYGVSHYAIHVAAGRTDDGVEFIYPEFALLNVYRSTGTVEAVG